MALPARAMTDGELQILNAIKHISLNGFQRASVSTAHTTSGTIAAGSRSLFFVASGDFVGTVMGIPVLAGAGFNVPVTPGDTTGAVAYTVSAGTLYSVEVR